MEAVCDGGGGGCVSAADESSEEAIVDVVLGGQLSRYVNLYSVPLWKERIAQGIVSPACVVCAVSAELE